MVFWKSSAWSMDPKKAVALSGWVMGSVAAACAGGVRLRCTVPAAAAAPSPTPKNFLRDSACIFSYLRRWDYYCGGKILPRFWPVNDSRKEVVLPSDTKISRRQRLQESLDAQLSDSVDRSAR